MKRRRHGFTLIEFLVAIGIVAILVAILLPYLEMKREDALRIDCADHLRQIGAAFLAYGEANQENYVRPLPQSFYDWVHRPQAYTAFTGPDGNMKSNDVTASLWLLVRGGYVKDLSLFICPSTWDTPDSMTDKAGRPTSAPARWNFRSPRNLSYSYDSPFTDVLRHAFSSDRLPEECAVLADQNPGFNHDGERVTGPARDAAPFDLAAGNSPNHQQAGQNVLHPSGDVSFEWSPYCGFGGDNIYTAAAPKPIPANATTRPAGDGPGFIGMDLGPAYSNDSYLVPTARDFQGD